MSGHIHAGTAANFTGADKLKLTICPGQSLQDLTIPPVISMSTGEGAVRFQFDMTAEGARALSKLLFDAAHALDSQTEDAQ